MANYYNKIKYLYPTAEDEDFTLQNDGSGDEIAYWDAVAIGQPKPTLVWLDAQISDVEHDTKIMWKKVRQERNQLLGESDYLILADAPVDETQKQEWTTYRQALRDIPQDYDSPDEVVYPDKPE